VNIFVGVGGGGGEVNIFRKTESECFHGGPKVNIFAGGPEVNIYRVKPRVWGAETEVIGTRPTKPAGWLVGALRPRTACSSTRVLAPNYLCITRQLGTRCVCLLPLSGSRACGAPPAFSTAIYFLLLLLPPAAVARCSCFCRWLYLYAVLSRRLLHCPCSRRGFFPGSRCQRGHSPHLPHRS
jgi:hypothetical protein